MRFALLIATVAVLVSSCDRSEPADPAFERIAYNLKDPESAKFRELHSTPEKLCGQLNSKNSYGGYVGFSRFIHDRLTETTEFEPDLPDSRSFQELEADCRDATHVLEIRRSCKPLSDLRDFQELWDAHCTQPASAATKG